jgi:flavin-binding protein dodecin
LQQNGMAALLATPAHENQLIFGTTHRTRRHLANKALQKPSSRMDWFSVVSQSGRIVDGKVEEFQVPLKIGFKIDR